MSSIPWLRVVASGVVWAAGYDLVWGAAWLAFMRREWLDAMAAINRGSPWTPDFWALWVVINLPIGVAVMAYVASRAGLASTRQSAVRAGIALGLLMTLGMAVWCWFESLSLRIFVLDSAVNLAGLAGASLAGAWSLQQMWPARLHRPGAAEDAV